MIKRIPRQGREDQEAKKSHNTGIVRSAEYKGKGSYERDHSSRPVHSSFQTLVMLLSAMVHMLLIQENCSIVRL